ncbi:MAG: trypsin-like peptidase domain-containing protein [Acidimicrobiia bacterium]|nr:trypsin-like peptidase domain-containing protein [Acidimicrobiia bacterium]
MTFVTSDEAATHADTTQESVLDPELGPPIPQPGAPGHGGDGSPPNPTSFPAAPARPRKWLATVVAAAVVAGAGAGAGVSALMRNDSTKTVTVPVGSSRNSSVIAQPSDVQGILAKVGPAVAYVRTQDFSPGTFFPSGGAGTGIVLTSDGELLTNAHVVNGATSIKVTVGSDTQSHDASLIGIDRNADLALVKIAGVSNLPTAQLGSSSGLKVGDSVIAIGNALNLQGGMTVTEGIVSALNRSIDAGGEPGSGSESLNGLIQTDAAINPGNSGGPLVNAAGQVVGINTATSGDAQNIGFAIAIDKAKPVIDQLRKGGSSSSAGSSQQGGQAFLGVSVTDGQTGALVEQVDPTAPAGRAGIQQGDEIVSLGDQPVQSADDLTTAMQSHKPGDKVTVTFLRGQSRQSASVTLASRQASQ